MKVISLCSIHVVISSLDEFHILLHLDPDLGNGTIFWLPWADLGSDFDGYQQTLDTAHFGNDLRASRSLTRSDYMGAAEPRFYSGRRCGIRELT